jgi:hypothetical protein
MRQAIMNLAKDKKLHFIAGAIIYLIAYLIFRNQTVALWLVFVAGAGKELIWDELFKRGHSCHVDFAFTMYGGFYMAVVMLPWVLGGAL